MSAMIWSAALSCSPVPYRFSGAGFGVWLTGKLGSAWVGAWRGAWCWCRVWCIGAWWCLCSYVDPQQKGQWLLKFFSESKSSVAKRVLSFLVRNNLQQEPTIQQTTYLFPSKTGHWVKIKRKFFFLLALLLFLLLGSHDNILCFNLALLYEVAFSPLCHRAQFSLRVDTYGQHKKRKNPYRALCKLM